MKINFPFPEFITDNESFPYSKSWQYSDSVLRSTLYISPDPDDPNIYDLDGIKQWYESIRKTDELFSDVPFDKYIGYHLGRTVCPVSVPDIIPIVFINCSSAPFVTMIMDYRKLYETRSRNTLRSLIGKRVLIAETGNGSKPVVRCSAIINKAFKVESFHEWDMFRDYTQVSTDSPFEWSDRTRYKWLYELDSVRPVEPFIPKEGIRHGRTWMEYN